MKHSSQKGIKIVYVVGPFRAANAWEVEQNVRQAEEAALAIWRLGAAVICPHANTRFFQGAAPDNTWLQGDLEILRRCDAVYLLPRWIHSIGSKTEHDAAENLGIKRFYALQEVAAWLKRGKTSTRSTKR